MWKRRLWKVDGTSCPKKIDFEWWVWQLEKVELARTFEHLWKSENLGKFKHLWISEHLKIFGDGRGSWGRSSWRVPSLPEVDCYALPCVWVRVCWRSFWALSSPVTFSIIITYAIIYIWGVGGHPSISSLCHHHHCPYKRLMPSSTVYSLYFGIQVKAWSLLLCLSLVSTCNCSQKGSRSVCASAFLSTCNWSQEDTLVALLSLSFF